MVQHQNAGTPYPRRSGKKLLRNFFSKKLRVQPVGPYPDSRAVRGSIACGRALPPPRRGARVIQHSNGYTVAELEKD